MTQPVLTPEVVAALQAMGLVPPAATATATPPQPHAVPAFSGGPPIAENARVPAANPAYDAAMVRTSSAPVRLNSKGNVDWDNLAGIGGVATPHHDDPMTIAGRSYITVGPTVMKDGTRLSPEQIAARANVQQSGARGGMPLLDMCWLLDQYATDAAFRAAYEPMVRHFASMARKRGGGSTTSTARPTVRV